MNIPDYCYALNHTTINPETKIGKVIKIKALESGYYPCTGKMTQEEIDAWNLELGTDLPTAKAMEAASMFGWDTYSKWLETYQKLEVLKGELK